MTQLIKPLILYWFSYILLKFKLLHFWVHCIVIIVGCHEIGGCRRAYHIIVCLFNCVSPVTLLLNCSTWYILYVFTSYLMTLLQYWVCIAPDSRIDERQFDKDLERNCRPLVLSLFLIVVWPGISVYFVNSPEDKNIQNI